MLTILLLGLVSFLTDVSTEMVYPLIPLYLTTTLGATPAMVGLIEGIAESLASLLKVFSGYFSDKIQRRKPLAVLGYGLATLGKAFLYFSPSWSGVLLGRVTDRFGKGIRTAPRDALIAQAAPRKSLGRAYGLHRALDTLGAVVGIALAFSFFRETIANYRQLFLISLLPALLGVLLLFAIRETPTEQKKPKKQATPANAAPRGQRVLSFSWWRALNPRLQGFLLVAFLFTLGNSSNQFLLLRAQNLGLPPARVLLVYLLFNAVYALASYPAGRLSDHLGRRWLLVSGYCFYGLVYLGFALARTPGQIWALFAVYGLYHALTQGVERAFIAEIAAPAQRGTLLGLHATLVGIGLLPASLLAGWLWDHFGAVAPFYFGGGIGFLAAFALGWLFRPSAARDINHA